MKTFIRSIIFCICIGSSNYALAQPKTDKRPNIILIVADDLGYTDLGCYGGEIKTPNIDALAKRGIQFLNFHASPLCAPTRSMLLSGNDNHVAGMGSMFPVKGTSREGKPGYEGHLSDRIVTIAQLLKDGGYQTFMSGKWHLGFQDAHIPYAKGFEKSYTLLNGGAGHFNAKPIFRNQPPVYREDDKPATLSGYSTDVFTDRMLGFLEHAKKDKPFFAYLAYTAPHWPLQVPDDWISRYKGHYDMGYDSLRVLRFNSQKAAGILPRHATLPPRTTWIKPWSALTAEEQRLESKKMELYAAMVEYLDQAIGKVVQYLEEAKLAENTVIVFISDNGAAGEDFYNDDSFGPFLREQYNNSYDSMGKPSSFVSYGPQWAQAGAAPFNLFKGYATQGGIVAPLIIAGAGIHNRQAYQRTFTTVMDIAPGFLELAGLAYPAQYNNKPVAPMLGESFVPFVRGKAKSIHRDDYVYGLEHAGQCMLIKGNWKISNISSPFDENAFALYNLAIDYGGTKDLSRENPRKFQEMMQEWKLFTKKTGVIMVR